MIKQYSRVVVGIFLFFAIFLAYTPISFAADPICNGTETCDSGVRGKVKEANGNSKTYHFALFDNLINLNPPLGV